MIHKIKVSECFYEDIRGEIKQFELRKDDRGYEVGDYLLMVKTQEGEETNSAIVAKVTYKLEGYTGLERGYCILGIEYREDFLP